MKGAHLYMELLHQSLNHPMPHRTGHNAGECLESLLNLEGMVAHVNRLIKQALVKCGPCPPIHDNYQSPAFKNKEKLFVSTYTH